MGKKSTPMTQKRASEIQSVEAKKNGGQVAKGGFAARATKAAVKNTKKKK